MLSARLCIGAWRCLICWFPFSAAVRTATLRGYTSGSLERMRNDESHSYYARETLAMGRAAPTAQFRCKYVERCCARDALTINPLQIAGVSHHRTCHSTQAPLRDELRLPAKDIDSGFRTLRIPRKRAWCKSWSGLRTCQWF